MVSSRLSPLAVSVSLLALSSSCGHGKSTNQSVLALDSPLVIAASALAGAVSASDLSAASVFALGAPSPRGFRSLMASWLEAEAFAAPPACPGYQNAQITSCAVPTAGTPPTPPPEPEPLPLNPYP